MINIAEEISCDETYRRTNSRRNGPVISVERFWRKAMDRIPSCFLVDFRRRPFLTPVRPLPRESVINCDAFASAVHYIGDDKANTLKEKSWMETIVTRTGGANSFCFLHTRLQI